MEDAMLANYKRLYEQKLSLDEFITVVNGVRATWCWLKVGVSNPTATSTQPLIEHAIKEYEEVLEDADMKTLRTFFDGIRIFDKIPEDTIQIIFKWKSKKFILAFVAIMANVGPRKEHLSTTMDGLEDNLEKYTSQDYWARSNILMCIYKFRELFGENFFFVHNWMELTGWEPPPLEELYRAWDSNSDSSATPNNSDSD